MSRLSGLVDARREESLVLVMLALGFVFRMGITVLTDGGADLLLANAPSTLKFLEGGNPYDGEPWLNPYPPLHVLFLAGIVRGVVFWKPIGLEDVVGVLRVGLVVGHVALAGIAYFVLKARNGDLRTRLLVPAVVLFSPSFTHVGEAWFHGDIFGLLLLAGGLLAFVQERLTLGGFLVSLAASFKIHVFLAIPLLVLWFVRRRRGTVGNFLATVSPFVFLTVLPLLFVPGYYDAMIGSPTSVRVFWSPTLLVLFYRVFPAYGLELSLGAIGQIWLLATVLLFCVAILVTWLYGQSLEPVDLVVLGAGAWLLPLRQLYPHYLFWVLVPFALRGRLRRFVLVFLLFELAGGLTGFLWWQFPGWAVSSQLEMVGLLLASAMLLSAVTLSCFLFVWRDARVSSIVRERESHSFVSPSKFRRETWRCTHIRFRFWFRAVDVQYCKSDRNLEARKAEALLSGQSRHRLHSGFPSSSGLCGGGTGFRQFSVGE